MKLKELIAQLHQFATKEDEEKAEVLIEIPYYGELNIEEVELQPENGNLHIITEDFS